jgi:hypothetical protein
MRNFLETVTWITKRLLAASLLIALLIAFSFQAAGVSGVRAAGPLVDAGPGESLIQVIYAVAEAFIKVLVFSSVAIFAASIARGTWSAQLANLVGSPMGMSQAWLNIIAAIFTFILAVLSPMLVSMVFDIVKGFVETTITIPSF